MQQWSFLLNDKQCAVIRKKLHLHATCSLFRIDKWNRTWTTFGQLFLVSIAVLISSHSASAHFLLTWTRIEYEKSDLLRFWRIEMNWDSVGVKLSRRSSWDLFSWQCPTWNGIFLFFPFIYWVGVRGGTQLSAQLARDVCTEWKMNLNRENNKSDFSSLSLSIFLALCSPSSYLVL